jgi:Carboxypeptidase regulatory-like domain
MSRAGVWERRVAIILGSAWLVLAPSTQQAAAQDFRGRINGVVTDESGAMLPGVTVTATSPALIQPQVVTTGEDGNYRLIALPGGVYTLTFELASFTTLKRESIRVVIGQTLTVDAKLVVATLQEALTVTAEAPVLDRTTTTVSTNFTKELLTEIPNARDIWAAMSQAPGLQMTGYDVGGSHTGTQTGYMTYGLSQQNTTKLEGVNVTEATNANAGYFDFGSFEEFQIGGAGNGAEQDVPGASLNVTVKSGGDNFSGMWYSDWEGKSTVSNNVPDEWTVAGGSRDGFKAPNTAGGLRTGNPIDRQYDLNASIGGPIYKRKAWFFVSWRHNDQFRTIIGLDDLTESKLTNQTGKGTFQLSRNNQLIGFYNKRTKLQPLRDFSTLIPISAAYYQASRNYPMKVEWTSILSDRLFFSALVGQWYNFFPLRPSWEGGSFDKDSFGPGRLDLDTMGFAAGGANDLYQDRKRYKPQFAANLSYFKDGWKGSHDMKLGFEWKRDRRHEGNDQPFDTVYRERAGVPVEVDIYNTPVIATTDVISEGIFLRDDWKITNRLTLNLGLRVEHYTDGWPEQSQTPNGIPALANTTDQRIIDFLAPRTVGSRNVAESWTAAPRIGFAFDLTGTGKTVVKGFYGRFYFNSTDIVADNENPVGDARLRFRMTDLNGNRLLDGPQELGVFLQTVGGAGFVRVDPNLERPYGEEVSGHFEQEVFTGLTARASYVYKNVRNDWGEVDIARIGEYTREQQVIDNGVDGVRGTEDDRTLTLLDLSRTGLPTDRMWTNPEGYTSDYHTVEAALNRRFRDNWMLLTSFGYTWLSQNNGVTSTTTAVDSIGLSKTFNWPPNQRMFGDGGREHTSIWNYKLIGRYVLPYSLGVSGSYKLQSGRQWGRTISAPLTNAGSQTVRVEPVDARRAPNVGIFDVRVDKSFSLPGRAGKVTAMVDVFNLTNSNTVTNFRITTGATFQEVLAILDPRILRFGVRYEF